MTSNNVFYTLNFVDLNLIINIKHTVRIRKLGDRKATFRL